MQELIDISSKEIGEAKLCINCEWCYKPSNKPVVWQCRTPFHVERDYVSGTIGFTKKYCWEKNRDGKCRDFSQKETAIEMWNDDKPTSFFKKFYIFITTFSWPKC